MICVRMRKGVIAMRLPALPVSIATLLMAACCFGAPFAQSKRAAQPAAGGDELAAALARMDATSATFKGLTADIKKIAHTDVINANETDIGSFTVKRAGRSGKEL